MTAQATLAHRLREVNRLLLFLLAWPVAWLLIWTANGLVFFGLVTAGWFELASSNNNPGGVSVLMISLGLPLISAGLSGLAVATLVTALSRSAWYGQHRRRGQWLVAAGLWGASFVAQAFTYTYFLPRFVLGLPQAYDLSLRLPEQLFHLNPVWVGLLLLHLSTRERQRTRRITEQEYQLLRLRELNTKAELDALQAKINPHFLYNALNSVVGLIREDPDRAEEMVLLLARFFRYSTGRQGQFQTTLAEEVELVSTYLKVEKVRFGDRLRYAVHCAEPDLMRGLVPAFLLQPLVENALKHGLSSRTEGGEIAIRIGRNGNQLRLAVCDDGAPFPAEPTPGYGLQSTLDKLRLVGGSAAGMAFLPLPDKCVQIWLPLQLAENEKVASRLPDAARVPDAPQPAAPR